MQSVVGKLAQGRRSGRRASAWVGDEKKQKRRGDADCADPAEGGDTSQREGGRTERRAERESEIHEGAVEGEDDRRVLQAGDADQACLLRRGKTPSRHSPDNHPPREGRAPPRRGGGWGADAQTPPGQRPQR